MSSVPSPGRRLWVAPLGGIDRVQRGISKSSPVRAHTFVMSLLFSTALIVGYVLLPGDSERIAMLERDGKTSEARQILETQFRNGDRRQRTLYLLQGLYEQAGDVPKARQTLELLAEQRPRDAALQRQLGQFYKLTHAEPEYIKALLAQIDLRYSEPACKEVIGLLRRSGAFGEEQAALQKCRQKGYRRPEDMVRLASLLAVDGEVKEASLLLRAVDDLRRLKTDRERLQLFDLLVENDQPGEAQRRASRWVKGNKDDTFALTLISRLVADNRYDFAIELARETSVPGDSVFLAIGEIMLERNQTQAAQSILRGWLEKAGDTDPSVAARFISAAIAAGSPDLALVGAQKFGYAKLPVAASFELAKSLEAAGRKADALSVLSNFNAAQGAATLDAQSATAQPGNARPAAAGKVANLDGWRTALWKRLRDENKPASATGASGTQSSARPVRAIKDLRALRLTRKANSYRRLGQPKPKAGQQVSPFNFLTPY